MDEMRKTLLDYGFEQRHVDQVLELGVKGLDENIKHLAKLIKNEIKAMTTPSFLSKTDEDFIKEKNSYFGKVKGKSGSKISSRKDFNENDRNQKKKEAFKNNTFSSNFGKEISKPISEISSKPKPIEKKKEIQKEIQKEINPKYQKTMEEIFIDSYKTFYSKLTKNDLNDNKIDQIEILEQRRKRILKFVDLDAFLFGEKKVNSELLFGKMINLQRDLEEKLKDSFVRIKDLVKKEEKSQSDRMFIMLETLCEIGLLKKPSLSQFSIKGTINTISLSIAFSKTAAINRKMYGDLLFYLLRKRKISKIENLTLQTNTNCVFDLKSIFKFLQIEPEIIFKSYSKLLKTSNSTKIIPNDRIGTNSTLTNSIPIIKTPPKQSIQKQSIQKQSIQKQSIQKQSIQKQSIQKQSIQRQSINKQSFQKNSLKYKAAILGVSSNVTSSELVTILREDGLNVNNVEIKNKKGGLFCTAVVELSDKKSLKTILARRVVNVFFKSCRVTEFDPYAYLKKKNLFLG